MLSNAFPVAQIRKDVLSLRQDGTEPNAPLLSVEDGKAVGQLQLQFSSLLVLRPSCLKGIFQIRPLTVTSSACSVSRGHKSLCLPQGSANSCARTRPICLLCEGGREHSLSSCLLLGCPMLTRSPGFSCSPDISHEPSPSPPHFSSDISSSCEWVKHAASPAVTHTDKKRIVQPVPVWSQPSFHVLPFFLSQS